MRSNPDPHPAETTDARGRTSRPLFFDTHFPPPSRTTPSNPPPDDVAPASISNPLPTSPSQVVPQRVHEGGRLAIPRSFPVAWCSLLFAGCLSLSPPAGNTTFRVPGEFVTTRYSVPESAKSGPTEFPTASLGDAPPDDARSTTADAGEAAKGPAETSISPPPAAAASPGLSATAPAGVATTPEQPSSPDESLGSRTLVAPNFGDGRVGEGADDDAFPRPELNAPERRAVAAVPKEPMPEKSPVGPPVGDPLEHLTLDVVGPDRRQVGAGATFQVTIRNNGEVPADQVVVTCEFDEALTFGDSKDREVRQRLGRVAAGETKELSLTLVAETAGKHCARFALKADDSAASATAQPSDAADEKRTAKACVEYIPRTLSVTISGPSRRTTGSRAEFAFRVANLTDEPIKDVVLEATRDGSLVLRELTAGSKRSAGRIRWEIGTLGPREEVVYQAEFECRAPRERATVGCAISAEGLAPEEREATLEVVPVTGLLDVRLSDVDDPVTLGGAARCEVRVTNLGLQPVRKVVVRAASDARLSWSSAEAWVGETRLELAWKQEGDELRFDPLPELAPDATLRIVLTGQGNATGDAETTVRVAHETPDSEVSVSEITQVAGPVEKSR